ncbi:hypothetical protein L3X38_037501 [Prunus dulcis]|uniref:NB-ARC domain-containing protein n=1 Tax=Prunus dulcis TaxID=3755 RepID=A0AAD4V4T1_PRUDU|nr:hypothetical protein L3X38_037501 [Prunus dulcis]
MGSQQIFTIPVLTPKESWELFCEIIGKPLDYPDLAKRVTKKCAGLPIAILTVVKALENKRKYGWGRGYFGNTDSVEEARNRVHYLVDKLQRRFLLLNRKLKDHTKMHDIVRDVAIQIASRDPHRFLIRCDAEKKWWPKMGLLDPRLN